VGEQVVSEQHGLGMLHVRHTGHYHLLCVLGNLDKPLYQHVHIGCRFQYGIAQIHAEVRCDLIVPAPSRMQFASDMTHDISKDDLNGGVYVLHVTIYDQLILPKVIEYHLQSIQNDF
jgi:hypothetical protein